MSTRSNLGVALQLTNILRDVPGDLAQGRLYLLIEDLQRYGCSEDDLSRRSPRLAAAFRRPRSGDSSRARLCERDRTYARANATLPREDRRRMVAAEIMGAIYRGILTGIEAAHYDVFSQTIRVPRRERAMIAARVWLRTLAGF